MGAEQAIKALQLLEGLAEIKAALAELRVELKLPKGPSALERIGRLTAAVESIGDSKPAKPLVCPEEYLAQWHDFLARRRNDLAPRAIRYLCWEADVATDRRFLDYLEKSKTEVRARSLQGLVRCYHSRWSELTEPARKWIERQLRRYDGPNRIVRSWCRDVEMVVGARGPEKFSDDMIEGQRSLKAQCERWLIDPQSAFALESMRHSVATCRANLEKSVPAGVDYALTQVLTWDGWPLTEFKKHLSKWIIEADGMGSAPLTERLKLLILRDTRLFDPRLPANSKNWVGIPDDARRCFIRWLSREDIEFFFEHVLPKGKDPHKRKRFWLNYVKQVQMSRPLLCWADEARLKALARRDGSIRNFGVMEGSASTSAFLLDFGPVLVVEFSAVGNACHIYERADVRVVVPDFWSTDAFAVSGRYGLKRPDRAERISHIVGWQENLAALLARYGIRPT